MPQDSTYDLEINETGAFATLTDKQSGERRVYRLSQPWDLKTARPVERDCDALRTAVDRLLELTSGLESDSVGQDWPELLEAVKRLRAVRGGADD